MNLFLIIKCICVEVFADIKEPAAAAPAQGAGMGY